MKRILIAGIGNIFYGDDAFGVEVVRQLSQREWPDEVTVVDFGIRGYDLAFALTQGYDAIIFVDAVARDEPPGTTCLMELDLEELAALPCEAPDAHTLNLVSVLQMARTLGPVSSTLLLVGCEPAVLESEDGQLELSEAVRASLPHACELVEEAVNDLLTEKTAGLVPA